MRTAEEIHAKLQRRKDLKGNTMTASGPPSKQEKSTNKFEMNTQKIKIWDKFCVS